MLDWAKEIRWAKWVEGVFWSIVILTLYCFFMLPFEIGSEFYITLYKFIQGGNEKWMWMSYFICLAMVSFYFIFRYYNQYRAIIDTPKAKIRSAAQGYVALDGLGYTMPNHPIFSPLTGTECIWYKFEVKKNIGRNQWVTVSSGESEEIILLQDNTGKCFIDPEQAEISAERDLVWYGSSPEPNTPDHLFEKSKSFSMGKLFSHGKYRYEQSIILPKDNLYVIGMFRTIGNNDSLEETKEDREAINREQVIKLLKQWKSDYQSLLARFDTNKDGILSGEEHERVIQAAEAEISEKYKFENKTVSSRQDAQPVNLVSKDGILNGKPFIISSFNPVALASSFRSLMLLYLSFFLIFMVFSVKFDYIYMQFYKIITAKSLP